MKKIATLLLAAGMIFGATTGANAIDFKAKGQWIMSFDYGEGGKFMSSYKDNRVTGWDNYNKNSGQDEFEARQRVRLQLDAVASESLSGTVYFEIGSQFWGRSNQGGALGADGNNVIKLKNAYIDWMIPETDAKVRMGIQHVTLPSYTIGANTVFDDDVAGVSASFKVNDMVSITGIWMRPFNDNFGGNDQGNGYYKSPSNYMDNMDLVALLVPLTFDGAKVTPWGMYGAIGPNTFRDAGKSKEDFKRPDGTYNLEAWNNYNKNYLSNTDNFSSANGGAAKYAAKGLFPVGGSRNGQFKPKNQRLNSYGQAWWGGITGEVTIWDPFRLAWDFTYGSVQWDNNGSLMRQGWLASLLLEYKMDWGIPGIYGWYGSGDDNNPANGSERLPTVSANNTNEFSHFAMNGDPYIARDGLITEDMSGTWGIGIRLKDMSFIENLKHTFRVNYISGTNSPSMAKKMSREGLWANGTTLEPYSFGGQWYGGTSKSNPWGSASIGHDAMYLTTEDHALEFGLTNTYKMYENFTIQLEADYIAMWLDTDKSVWGARHKYGQSVPTSMDAWNINASFVYSF